jgi:hypothetical protein
MEVERKKKYFETLRTKPGESMEERESRAQCYKTSYGRNLQII